MKAITITVTSRSIQYMEEAKIRLMSRVRLEKGQQYSGVPKVCTYEAKGEIIEAFDLFLASGDIIRKIPYAAVEIVQ